MSKHIDLGTGILHEIFDIRDIAEENYHPVVTHSPLWENFKRDSVQIKVNFLGEQVWLNVTRKYLSENNADK